MLFRNIIYFWHPSIAYVTVMSIPYNIILQENSQYNFFQFHFYQEYKIFIYLTIYIRCLCQKAIPGQQCPYNSVTYNKHIYFFLHIHRCVGKLGCLSFSCRSASQLRLSFNWSPVAWVRWLCFIQKKIHIRLVQH